jgi:hypothetical protein
LLFFLLFFFFFFSGLPDRDRFLELDLENFRFLPPVGETPPSSEGLPARL